MARRPKKRGRDVNGVLLLDKPFALSSNQALQRVKHLYRANRAGHTGSLDPMATGLLPICFGEATKVAHYLLDTPKAYLATMKLGQQTETGDKEGTVIRRCPLPKDWQVLARKTRGDFVGPIKQVPPMYSALKVNGEKLYQLARRGQQLERAPRPVTIYRLEIRSCTEDELTFFVVCSKGTYIRTLAENWGEHIGCCAHLTALRRCQVGPYHENNMVTMDLIESGDEVALGRLLMPIDSAICNWPIVRLEADDTRKIQQGQIIWGRAVSPGMHRVYCGNQLIALGCGQEDGSLKPKRLICPL